jgi:hypothetical protein
LTTPDQKLVISMPNENVVLFARYNRVPGTEQYALVDVRRRELKQPLELNNDLLHELLLKAAAELDHPMFSDDHPVVLDSSVQEYLRLAESIQHRLAIAAGTLVNALDDIAKQHDVRFELTRHGVYVLHTDDQGRTGKALIVSLAVPQDDELITEE